MTKYAEIMLKAFALILLSAIMFAVSASAEIFTHGELNYEIIDEQTCRVVSSPSAKGNLIIPNEVGTGDPDAMTSYRVVEIADGAFRDCMGLLSVQMPVTINRIGAESFRRCSSLKVAEIGAGVKEIGEMAFRGCVALEDMQILSPDVDCDRYIFNGCTSLESLSIPDGWSKLPAGFFSECAALRKVKLPSTLETIGDEAFSGCCSLDYIKVPDSVQHIGRKAFFGCSGLNVVYLGKRVSELQTQAFDKCINMSEIVCRNSIPPASALYPFDESIFSTCRLTIPIGRRGAYSGTYPWSEFQDIIENDYPGLYAHLEIVTPENCIGFDENYGTAPAVRIESAEGWTVHSVTLDNEDVSGLLSDSGLLRFPALVKDVVLRVVFSDVTQGVEQTENGCPSLRVAVNDLQVKLIGLTENQHIEVFGLSGICVYSGTDHSFSVPSEGVYIISISNQKLKVRV